MSIFITQISIVSLSNDLKYILLDSAETKFVLTRHLLENLSYTKTKHIRFLETKHLIESRKSRLWYHLADHLLFVAFASSLLFFVDIT